MAFAHDDNRSLAPWHLLTGEYPPEPGGVADYTHGLALGLAGAGCDVHVWAPALGDQEQGTKLRDEVPLQRLSVHREVGRWTRADLLRLGRLLDAFPAPRRLLLQFAPNAFGSKGLNLSLGAWLRTRRRAGDFIHVMFHEVTYLVKPGDRWPRRVLAWGQRRLAAQLLRAANTVDVAIPYWERVLRPLDAGKSAGRIYHWRPVPSNIPVVTDPPGVVAARARLAPLGVSHLIGSFGTFAEDVVAQLAPALLPLLLGHPDRAAVLIGGGSERVAEAWLRTHPDLKGRVTSTGRLEPAAISRCLQACDLLLQPYPGGVCTKRGSLMAGIAHGVATVTNQGEVSEPIWSSAVGLVLGEDARALTALAESLLRDSAARAHLGAAGRALYDARFAMTHTVAALVAAAPKVEPERPEPAQR
jgi:glycosyltransferase involved in cell wall biosynthesis